MSDIVKKLRFGYLNTEIGNGLANKDALEAAYEINRLRAENAELVMSLEWAVSEIEDKTRYTKENQFGKCLACANETLAKHKKD